MIEFIPGRRYVFRNPVGLFIGTFVELRNGYLHFERVTHVVETSERASTTFVATQVLDAEPWQQDIQFDASTSLTLMHDTAELLEARKSVVIARAKPNDVTKW